VAWKKEELDDLFAFKRQMMNFDRQNRPSTLDPLRSKLRIWVYDMPTAITGHSCCDEPIPEEDSLKINEIAANILYAAPERKPNLQALLGILREDTKEDRWAKDIERLLLLKKVNEMQQKGVTPLKDFQTHWAECREKWKTMEGMMLSYEMKYNRQAA